MGHWGMSPLDFQLFNFSGQFRAAQTLTLDSMWLSIPRKNILAYRFSAVYCIKIITFLCSPLIIFFLVLCPSSEPNPGNATDQHDNDGDC